MRFKKYNFVALKQFAMRLLLIRISSALGYDLRERPPLNMIMHKHCREAYRKKADNLTSRTKPNISFERCDDLCDE